jgi:hypothetical protein
MQEDYIRIKRQAARSSVDTVTQKLNRCIEPLKKHVTLEGRLDEGDQYAIRVLNSRIRFLERLFNFLHGTPRQKERAEIELLKVRKRDDGQLIQLGEKNHSVGRLDCKACDWQEVDIDGTITRESAGRLCTSCGAGIQHVYIERMDMKDPLYSIPPVLTPTEPELNAPATRYDALQVWKRYVCDVCGAVDSQYTGTETVAPQKERWRQVML